MLFDLRGRGRRRTVQAIYLTLALLMGGGLVLFGIGGEVQGGLFDAVSGNQGDDGTAAIERRVEQAETRVQRNRADAAAWAALAQAQFQRAGVGEGFDEATGRFTAEGRRHLQAAARAWERHLALAETPNDQVAALMVNAFTALNRLDDAVRAQEVVVEQRDPAFGLYATLANLAYQAGQTRKGDLAARRAVELAPKDQRSSLREQLDSLKEQATRQQIEEATGGQGGSAGSGAGALP